ncbi:MAG: S9 family peptidase, partial [Planctomycetota bacterium]
KARPKADKRHQDGTTLVVRNILTGKETKIPGVTSFGLTRKTGWLWYAQNSKKDDPKIVRGLHARNLGTGETFTLVKGAAKFQGLTIDREETRLAFCSDLEDANAKAKAKAKAETKAKAQIGTRKPTFDLYTWDFKAPAARLLVTHRQNQAFPKGRMVRSRGLTFSRQGNVLLFGADPLPPKDLPDILDGEKVVLDLWHWKDPLLQPNQAKQAERLRNQPLTCAWHFDGDRMVVLSERATDSVRLISDDGSRALVTNSEPYAQMVSWDGRYSDVWVVDTRDGSRKKLKTRLRSSPQPSPNGRYVLYFKDRAWHCIDTTSGTEANLTGKLKVPFAQEDWDKPSPKRAHGIAGWVANDAAVLLYDKYDIWKVQPDGSGASCLTDGHGRTHHIRFRYTRLDPEERHIPADQPLLLAAVNLDTMDAGFFTDRLAGANAPSKRLMAAKSVSAAPRRGRRRSRPTATPSRRRFGSGSGIVKAKEHMFFTMSTFREPPDLWVSDLDFRNRRRLTSLNPQQQDIRWGDAELVHWHSLDGKPLKGILIKPEGFDPKNKYPLMVHFYERMSQNLHRYISPQPGTSPNAAYYVSNGYLWFMPDIHYREGYPGESALKCIVPGVQALIARGFVKADGIGAAGHSWGGYQTAYLVTKTDIFKAIESGAPVSNMTSAYGGIRWSTGLSRAWQYEKSQSRIGGSLWEYPMRYLENSPLFQADKVNTPVLMLHNDQDGAVPWYQGIEYFCALRRLGKEVYLFNYVGEPHGLRKRQNQKDWAMRMQQYFDHHLKGAPAPKWMRDGVPYIEREKFAFNEPRSVREQAAMEASAKKSARKSAQKPKPAQQQEQKN